jgi:hypothetical protein
MAIVKYAEITHHNDQGEYMAHDIIKLGNTELDFADITVEWCKKISNNAAVSQTGMTLTERGGGIYKLTNPNITEDTDYYIYETASPENFVVGIFSPADNDLARQTTLASILSIFAGITSMGNWLRGLFRPDTMNATAKAEVNLGDGTFNEATDSLPAISDITAATNSRVNNLGITEHLQTNLTDIKQIQDGDNYIKIDVLITDANSNLFDPADITDPGVNPRFYNGVGAIFTDINDNKIAMFADNVGTPLGTMNLCHHAPQVNLPQLLTRASTGIYYFWINATAAGDALPVGKLTAKFAYFEITQADATYGANHINDTDPSSHRRVMLSVTVESAQILTGSRAVTIQLYETGGTTPIADADISVHNEGLSLYMGRVGTDANGQRAIGRDDGTYALIFQKAGWTFTPTPAIMVVDGNATHTYYGDTVLIPQPGNPDACLLIIDLIDIGVEVSADVAFTVELKNPPKAVSGNIIDPSGKEFKTDIDGHLEITLVKGCKYDVKSKVLKQAAIVIDTTDQTSINLADEL